MASPAVFLMVSLKYQAIHHLLPRHQLEAELSEHVQALEVVAPFGFRGL